jgi:hypothetical protein
MVQGLRGAMQAEIAVVTSMDGWWNDYAYCQGPCDEWGAKENWRHCVMPRMDHYLVRANWILGLADIWKDGDVGLTRVRLPKLQRLAVV